MDQWEHPLAKFILGRHEDALAVEEDLGVLAPRSREALAPVMCGLAVDGGSHPNVIDEAEGRPGDGVEHRCVVGPGLAVAARESVGCGVEVPWRYSTAKTKPNSLLSHWCCGIMDNRWSRRYFKL